MKKFLFCWNLVIILHRALQNWNEEIHVALQAYFYFIIRILKRSSNFNTIVSVAVSNRLNNISDSRRTLYYTMLLGQNLKFSFYKKEKRAVEMHLISKEA